MALTDKLTAIADAIRGKTGKSDSMTLDQMPMEIAGIQAGGGGGENPLDYATHLSYMFYNGAFTSGTELDVSFGGKAAINAAPTTVLNYTFAGTTGLKSVKVSSTLEFPSAYSASYFCNNSDVESMDLSGMPQPVMLSACDRMFRYCTALKEVLGELDTSACTTYNNFLTQTTSLETIRFAAGTIKISLGMSHSGNLTGETIQSIIDGLADLTGGTAQTLTLHATVGAKLTDAQKSAASAKNWTISY